MPRNDYAIVPDHIWAACGACDGFVMELRDRVIHYKGHLRLAA